MDVTKRRRSRRTHTEDFNQALVAACGEPVASVAGVALANGVNANQLRRWMRERGLEPPPLSCLPVLPPPAAVPGFVPVQLPQKTDPVIRLELRKGASSVKVEWPEGSAALCATWLREWLG